MKKKILVEGMKCENCAKHVSDALNSVDGITSTDVKLTEKYVIVDTNIEISDETIKLAVNNEKYNVIQIYTI